MSDRQARRGTCGGRMADAPAGIADGSCCRPAVVRTYSEMLNRGQPDRFAYEAAITVYRWHHPEVPLPDAADIVAAWVWDGVSH